MTPVAWVLAVGATYRLSLLVVADEITRRPREWALRRLDVESPWAYMLSCPWCVSPHLGLVVVGSGLWWSTGRGWQLAAGTLTASGATGIMSRVASPD